MNRRSLDPDIAPATLGSSLRAGVRLIVWCKSCNYQVEPDLAALVARLGPELPVPEWSARLRCSRCGSRDCDFVVTDYGGKPHAERR